MQPLATSCQGPALYDSTFKISMSEWRFFSVLAPGWPSAWLLCREGLALFFLFTFLGIGTWQWLNRKSTAALAQNAVSKNTLFMEQVLWEVAFLRVHPWQCGWSHTKFIPITSTMTEKAARSLLYCFPGILNIVSCTVSVTCIIEASLRLWIHASLTNC